METGWKPTPDELNIALSRTPRDMPSRRNDYAANMGGVGCPRDQLGNVGLDVMGMSFDQNQLMIVGGGILAAVIAWKLLGGSSATRRKTATAKARYISEFAAQTGRLPKGV